MAGDEFHRSIEDGPFPRGQEPADAVEMGLVEAARDDRVGQQQALGLGGRPSEGRFGLAVPVGDPALDVDLDEGVAGAVDDRPGPRRAGGQGRLGAAPLEHPAELGGDFRQGAEQVGVRRCGQRREELQDGNDFGPEDDGQAEPGPYAELGRQLRSGEVGFGLQIGDPQRLPGGDDLARQSLSRV